MIAFGLLAAPLRAENQTLDSLVTLTATAGDGSVTLNIEVVPPLDPLLNPNDFFGYQCRYKVDGAWSGWLMRIPSQNEDEGGWVLDGLTNGTTYSFQARVSRNTYSVQDGLVRTYTEPSDEVTVTPTSLTE